MNMIMERMISPTRPLVPSSSTLPSYRPGAPNPGPPNHLWTGFPLDILKSHTNTLHTHTHTMAYLIRRECERLQAESEHIDSMTFSSVSSTGFTQDPRHVWVDDFSGFPVWWPIWHRSLQGKWYKKPQETNSSTKLSYLELQYIHHGNLRYPPKSYTPNK